MTFRVLIVEDLNIARIVAVSLLKEQGCSISEAVTGNEALEFVTNERFDLILVDIGLPDIDGIEVTTTIRSGRSINANIPIVALTAHEHEEEKQKAFRAGMNDFLTKPLTQEKVNYILEKYSNLS